MLQLIAGGRIGLWWKRPLCYKEQKGLTEGLGTAFPQKGVPNIIRQTCHAACGIRKLSFAVYRLQYGPF